jgi:hypothetical protein
MSSRAGRGDLLDQGYWAIDCHTLTGFAMTRFTAKSNARVVVELNKKRPPVWMALFSYLDQIYLKVIPNPAVNT